MTDAQWKVEAKRISTNANYKLRKFRKECVTQGIVEFVRDRSFYQMKYRGQFVCYLHGNGEESLKLLAVWNTIKIAENNQKD